MAELDKDLVTMEIDLFWTTKAVRSGGNNKEISGRFELFQ
jgi:hypothetical protein